MDLRSRGSLWVGSLILGLLAAPAAVAGGGQRVTHEQVAPPGVIGCDPQPADSEEYPAAVLPARMVFRPGLVKVVMRLRRPSQATRATIRAYTLGGRRVDTASSSSYTCTSPGAENRIAISVKPRTVGAAIRRHGHVMLRVVVRMVNARGKQTTLRRTVLVTRE